MNTIFHFFSNSDPQKTTNDHLRRLELHFPELSAGLDCAQFFSGQGFSTVGRNRALTIRDLPGEVVMQLDDLAGGKAWGEFQVQGSQCE